MNVPNTLTLVRILLVPVFLACMYLVFPYHITLAVIVFLLASITDALDGAIARKRNLITSFGKFADPLADKILVFAALCTFYTIEEIPLKAWMLVTLAVREYLVSDMRLATVEKGVVVAASIWGKLKTAVTMVTILTILLFEACYVDYGILAADTPLFVTLQYVGLGLLLICVILTIVSGIEYFRDNAPLLEPMQKRRFLHCGVLSACLVVGMAFLDLYPKMTIVCLTVGILITSSKLIGSDTESKHAKHYICSMLVFLVWIGLASCVEHVNGVVLTMIVTQEFLVSGLQLTTAGKPLEGKPISYYTWRSIVVGLITAGLAFGGGSEYVEILMCVYIGAMLYTWIMALFKYSPYLETR